MPPARRCGGDQRECRNDRPATAPYLAQADRRSGRWEPRFLGRCRIARDRSWSCCSRRTFRELTSCGRRHVPCARKVFGSTVRRSCSWGSRTPTRRGPTLCTRCPRRRSAGRRPPLRNFCCSSRNVFCDSGAARLRPSSGQLSRAWMARSWACNMSRCDASAGSARRNLAAWSAAPTSPRRS